MHKNATYGMRSISMPYITIMCYRTMYNHGMLHMTCNAEVCQIEHVTNKYVINGM